ncbi:MAG: Hsp33 family molecular chaperone HslO, partial [Desulfuromonadales bacterium]|nr:Hsp33 family molecular chaperone HslO [Desulfuromonadales bacterium]
LPGATEDQIDLLEQRLSQLEPITTLLRQGLNPEAIAAKIFADMPYRTLGQTPLSFQCRCSRQQIEKMLKMLGAAELDAMIEEDDGAQVTCEFCREVYSLDGEALKQLKASL